MIDGTTQKGLVEKQASRDALIPTIRRGRKEDSCVNEERFFHHRKILPLLESTGFYSKSAKESRSKTVKRVSLLTPLQPGGGDPIDPQNVPTQYRSVSFGAGSV